MKKLLRVNIKALNHKIKVNIVKITIIARKHFIRALLNFLHLECTKTYQTPTFHDYLIGIFFTMINTIEAKLKIIKFQILHRDKKLKSKNHLSKKYKLLTSQMRSRKIIKQRFPHILIIIKVHLANNLE